MKVNGDISLGNLGVIAAIVASVTAGTWTLSGKISDQGTDIAVIKTQIGGLTIDTINIKSEIHELWQYRRGQ